MRISGGFSERAIWLQTVPDEIIHGIDGLTPRRDGEMDRIYFTLPVVLAAASVIPVLDYLF